MSATTPGHAPPTTSTADGVVLSILATLNIASFIFGGGATILIFWLKAKGDQSGGFFAFSMMVFGPIQLLLFIITAIVSLVGVLRRRMVNWYLVLGAFSLFALLVDIVGFVVAVWY